MVSHEDVNRPTVECELVWREVSNYLEGEVEGGLRARMEQHLATCKHCTSVLSGMRNVIQLYGDERMVEAPAGFGVRLEKRLTRNALPKRWWLSWRPMLVPVAAMVLIVGGLWLAKSRERYTAELAQTQQNRERAAKNMPADMAVVVTADGKLFHVAECALIRGQKVRSLTAKQALDEGYAPCPQCLRKYLDVAGVRKFGTAIVANLDDDDERPEPAAAVFLRNNKAK